MHRHLRGSGRRSQPGRPDQPDQPDRPDLRNPAQVRALPRDIGIDVPNTHSWRLERLRDVHPSVPALLAWRRSERIATTY